MWRLRTSKGQTIPVRRLPATVGSAPRCDVVVPHPSVAALHARLLDGGPGALVVEAEGEAVVGAGGRRVARAELRDGATLVLGRVRLDVVAPAPSAAPRAPGQDAAAPANDRRDRRNAPAPATTGGGRRPREPTGLLAADLSQLPWTTRLVIGLALLAGAAGIAWLLAEVVSGLG